MYIVRSPQSCDDHDHIRDGVPKFGHKGTNLDSVAYSYRKVASSNTSHYDTVLCIAVKVAVCHEIDTKCDFYDFPMPVYALETIYINFLRNF